MEVTGRIKQINAEQQVSPSFKKRELVVTTEEQYPQTLMIEFTQDKTELLRNFNPGEEVKVSINISGREWVNPQGETKYFTSLRGWRIERLQAEAQAPQYQQQQYQQPQYQQAPPQQFQQAPPQQFQPAPQQFSQEDPDDLPF